MYVKGRTLPSPALRAILTTVAALALWFAIIPAMQVQSQSDAPNILTLSAGNGQFTASWNAYPGATSYILLYRQQGSSDWTEVDLPGTATSHTVSNLADGSKYIVRLRANNGLNLRGSVTLPVAVSWTSYNLEATSGHRQFSATWNAYPGATGYKLLYRLQGGATWTEVTVDDGTATSTTVEGLTNGSTYIIRFKAVNDKGRAARAVAALGQPAILEALTVAGVPDGLPDYERNDWRHWVDDDSDCQNTRHEVLIEESSINVTFKTDSNCQVASGQWTGLFTGTQTTDPSSLDVDHMVPLANAHRSGGWEWSAAKKRAYANYLDYTGHLIAVTASANRSKGSRGPDEWKPTDTSYWCQYAIDWSNIKIAWSLTVTSAEQTALRDMLNTCDSVPATVPSLISFTEPEPELSDTYESCDAADEAGEPLIQGSKGSGRGYPKAKVPSARDGDGDGVVCER